MTDPYPTSHLKVQPERKTQRKPKLPISLNGIVLLTCIAVLAYFSYERYAAHKAEQIASSRLVLAPKVNDLYFLDFRLLSNELADKNKYRLAKVVGGSDGNITLVYGRFFYQWQHAVVNSIQYGNLINGDYFAQERHYFPVNKIKEMKANGTIYLIKRPMQNKLYGNFVGPE